MRSVGVQYARPVECFESRNHEANRIPKTARQPVRAVPHLFPDYPVWFWRCDVLGATRAGRARALAHGAGVCGVAHARTAPARAALTQPDGDGRVSLRWLEGGRGACRRVVVLVV